MKQFLLLIAVVLTVQANADNYRDMKPLKLETPEMKAELVKLPTMELARAADKYVGVGGRLRVRAQSAKDFGDFGNFVGAEDLLLDAGSLVLGELLKQHVL